MAQDDIKRGSDLVKAFRNKEKTEKLAREKEKRELIQSLAKELIGVLGPSLDKIAQQTVISKEMIADALSNIQVNVPPQPPVEVNVPPIEVPRAQINIDPVKMPTVNVPAPIVKIPERVVTELAETNSKQPLPVRLFDEGGKPFQFSLMGGGKANFLTIKDIQAPSGDSAFDSSGNLKTSGSATLSADTGSGEIGDDTLRMVMATDAITSVNVYDAFGSTAIDSVWNADNRLRVSVETGGSGLTDTELRASSVPVAQASGASWTTEAHLHALDTSGTWEQVRTNEGVAVGAVRVVHATDAITSVNVVGANASVAVVLQNHDGTTIDGDNPLPVDGSGVTQPVSGTVTANLSATDNAVLDNIDTNTSNTATAVQIMDDWDAVHGSAASSDGPQGMLEGRSTNPTLVDNGDAVRARADLSGRAITGFQARDLLQTAYVEASSEGEKTLLAGASSTYHDLVYMMGANSSDAAITIDIRQTTGGTVQGTLEIPANSTAGLALGGVSIPQDHADATWTVDNNSSDASNTTYAITALFSKES